MPRSDQLTRLVQARIPDNLRAFGFPGVRTILLNSSAMVGTALVTSGIGFPYWVLAARTLQPAAVGLGSAAVSAMTLLSLLGMLGLGTLLVVEFPRHPGNAGRLLATALAVSGAAGFLLGLVFSAAVHLTGGPLSPIGEGPVEILFFSLSVGVSSSALVLDGAMLGLLMGHFQFARNTLFALLKLALLWPLAAQSGMPGWLAIAASWSVGNLVASLPLGAFLLVKHGPRQAKPYWRFLGRLPRTALEHHALNLAIQLPPFALPVVVAAVASTQANAYFYAAWMIAAFVFIVPSALTQVLYSISVRDPSSKGRHLRFTLGLSLVGGAMAVLVTPLAAHPVLHLFGSAYANNATLPLQLIVLAVLPFAVKTHYVAVARIDGTIGKAALLSATGGVLELAAIVEGGRIGGLVGLTIGWVLAVTIQAAALLPSLLIAARSWGAFAGTPLRLSRKRREADQQGARWAPVTGQDGASAPRRDPILLHDIELSTPLPALGLRHADSGSYTSARLLVRLHGQPIGLLSMSLPGGGVSRDELADKLWHQLKQSIKDHMLADGLPEPASVPVSGLHCDGLPLCIGRRVAPAAAQGISVIVASRDRPELLDRCLSALAGQSHPMYEVLLVDNAPSTDSTAALFRGKYLPLSRFRYLLAESPGTSRARNLGVQMARYDVLAFTDDDAVPDKDWLMALSAAFASPRVCCVTGLTLPLRLETASEQLFEDHFGFPSRFTPRLFDLAENRPQEALFPYTTGQLGASVNLAVRAATFHQLGGFDPALGPGTESRGGEDLALLLDVIQSGHQLAYEPSAIVRHLHRSGMDGLRRQVFGYGVGLGAYLTRSVVVRPRRLLEIGPRVGRGLSYYLSRRSERDKACGTSFPVTLKRLERLGLLYGPAAYLRSRLRATTLR